MKPIAILASLALFGLTPVVAASDAGSARGWDRAADASPLSRTGAESAAPMSRLQLADNSDEGACEVTYGGSTQCHDSYR